MSAEGFTGPSSAAAYGPDMRCVIVVPTYDEAGTVPALLDAVQQARERISGNVPPLLAIEAPLSRIAVSHR